jgi:predicted amidophosphoribosyltransferase
MFCIKCGNNIPEGNRFCPVCGEPAEIELNPEDRTLTSYDGNQGHSEGIEEGGVVK